MLGSTLDAMDTASSVRNYLNSIGYDKTEVILLSDGTTEAEKNMTNQVSDTINNMLRKEGITVIDNARVGRLQGDYKLEKIYFTLNNEMKQNKDKKSGAWE